MTKNYAKIKIKNKKIILKEEGTKYGQAGMQAAQALGKMTVDALKMVRSTVKRAWGATFLYGYKIIVAVSKGDISDIHEVNRQFHQEDKAIKREQQQLIASQPGNKDAKIFMAMTCPAASAFSAYVDTDLEYFRRASYKFTKDVKKDEKDLYQSRVAFANIATSISNLAFDTPISFVKVQYSKKKKRKIEINSSVKKNIETLRFRAMCKYLQKFYKSEDEQNQSEDSEETNTKKKKKAEDTFYIGEKTSNVLKMFIEKESMKKIVNYIYEESVSSEIDNVAKSFLNNKRRKAKIKNDFVEFVKTIDIKENKSYEYSLTLKNNKALLIKEEENLPLYYTDGAKVKKSSVAKPSKSTTKEVEKKQSKGADGKTAMMLSFASYYMLSSKALLLTSSIQVKKNTALLVLNEKMLEAISLKSSLDSNLKSLFDNKIKEVSEEIKEYNTLIEKLKDFKINLKPKKSNDLKEINNAFDKNIEILEKSYDEVKDQDEIIKDITYGKVMIDIIQNIKPLIKDIDPTNSQSAIEDNFKLVNEFHKMLEENYKDVCESNSSLLAKNKINYQSYNDNKNKSMSSLSNLIQKNINSFKNIENFTSKENEIKSLIEEKEKELQSEETETDETETGTTNKVLKSKNIKSEIVKISN